ncbi:hypothetical protein L226DRAFT_322948 [Lentinus tigrinus ALCF2SS1-7]|uniref:Secreted protein n=1 Tax=Lentinus tigrinus ALCF2SS1-6 TaxID=1328759 RepID=A0A5C2SG52_9APHY|nr:hypothetical protein L227DRAFT_436027 [Lentinus tigrinus ALCF2SS1-6]RPD77463.1 hypothetical protein L226DRAFT_322948 [Lentinus tigrinus ALCF2SS1-7]
MWLALALCTSVRYSRTCYLECSSGHDWVCPTHNVPASLAPNWLVSADVLLAPSRCSPCPGHDMGRPKCEIHSVGVRHHGSSNATGPASPSSCPSQWIHDFGAR